jgi:hypothetical protein
MKKIIPLLFIILLLTGCSSKDNNENYDEELELTYLTKREIKCDEIKNAKLMNMDLFVTNDNIIYQYSLDETYGDLNCKKYASTTSKITGLYNRNLIDENKTVLIAPPSSDKLLYVDNYSNTYTHDEYYYGSSLIIRENNSMYSMVNNGDSNKKLDIQNPLPSNIKINSINGRIINADQGYYVINYRVTNKEECESDTTKECIKENYIEPSEILNKIKDKISIAFTKNYDDYDNTIYFYYNGFIYSINMTQNNEKSS